MARPAPIVITAAYRKQFGGSGRIGAVSSLSDARADVLVVGSGGAGMSAAVSAANAGAAVIVTTKSALGAGNTGRAQGGIQAAMGDDDSPESHFEDTFAAGHRAARPELVRQLTDGGPDAIAWLDRDRRRLHAATTGRLRLLRCGGASRKRLLQAGERTGAEMVQALRAAVRASGAEVWESTPPRRPRARRRRLARDGRARRQRRPPHGPRAARWCWPPAAGLRGEAERARRAAARTTPTRRPRCSGWRSSSGPRGASSTRWQRHPTGSVWPEALAGYALPETTRAYGATLHDADGERFVDELAPRDVVAAGDHRRGRRGARGRRAGRQRGRLARHDRDRPRERRRVHRPSGSPTSTTAT